jgi:hypothetical protein
VKECEYIHGFSLVFGVQIPKLYRKSHFYATFNWRRYCFVGSNFKSPVCFSATVAAVVIFRARMMHRVTVTHTLHLGDYFPRAYGAQCRHRVRSRSPFPRHFVTTVVEFPIERASLRHIPDSMASRERFHAPVVITTGME